MKALPASKLESNDLSPVVIRSGPDEMLIVYDGRTWKCSVSAILTLHEHKNTLRGIVKLRKDKHRSVNRLSARMSDLGQCKKEPHPLLVAFPIEDRLLLLFSDRAWECSIFAALRAPRQEAPLPPPGHETAAKSRQIIGVPAPELKCEEGLRQLSALVEADTDESVLFFHAGFVPVLNAALNKLIEWTERTESSGLKDWAGHVLADRVRFLSAQRRFWERTNSGFEKRWAEFGDLRGVRTPEAALAWWTGDYLRELVASRSHAHLYLSLIRDNPYAIADVLPDFEPKKKWLERLITLPRFDKKNWRIWAEAVFDRMREDEETILARRELRKLQTRDSQERRKNKNVRRLYDWKPQILVAIQSLANKPIGSVRGITKPPS